MHGFKAWRQRLHLFNNLGQLGTHVTNIIYAMPYLLRKSFHTHYAGCHCGLHFLDHLLNIQRRNGGLIGQTSDLFRDNGKSKAIFPGFFRFNGGIERQQVGLVGHFCNGHDHCVDVICFFIEHFKFRGY